MSPPTSRSVAGRLAASLVALLLLAACSGREQPSSAAPTTTAAPATAAPTTAAPTTEPAPAGPLSSVRLKLVRVATAEEPVSMTAPKGDKAIYLVEKIGRVRALRNGRLDPTPVLDITGQVALGGEQGLLGLAFSLDRRFLYVYYTDVDGNIRIVEYAMRGGRADKGSRRELLSVDHHQFGNHNGGQLQMAPDGTLWAGLGDGGSAGDPPGNAQNLGVLLGKIIRIDPRAGGGRPYRIPAGNPFVGRAGARPEIWAYGLRNPWRFSFDPANGDLWIGDVGQGAWEEVDHAPGSAGGRNYGWDKREGTHEFEGRKPGGAIDPVLEYRHAGADCSITGGVVYRGSRIPALRGAYLYGDYCAGWVRALRLRGGKVAERRDFGLNVPGIASFGVDQAGEPYALSLGGEIFRLAAA
jgi:glucose/arabinose dehydrogenase